MSQFDRLVDRTTSGDLKWNRHIMAAMTGAQLPETVYPMWIADGDFACPPHVLSALHARVDREIFGYPAMPRDFGASAAFWMERRFGWHAEPEWAVLTPGVIAGLHLAIRLFTEPGEGVVLQTPVYDHFFSAVTQSGRRVAENPLLCRDGAYRMDLDGLEALLQDPSNRLLVLCSPHNPVGRVWTRAELEALGGVCRRHGVAVVSDEIHADLVYGSRRHTPLLSLWPDAPWLQLSSPGKTFNMPGLKTAYALIPDPELRRRFQAVQASLSLEGKNTLGLTAFRAAYAPESLPWVDELTAYLAENAALAAACFAGTPLVMSPLEGTYLAWLDCRALGLDDRTLLRTAASRGVVPSGGGAYGTGGAGHLRLNLACPRRQLEAALSLLRAALLEAAPA